MSVDLHCHTTASDGLLLPAVLLARAINNGVTQLAITDHDTLAGYDRLAVPAGLRLINGIELSTQWRKTGIHVVGLNFDRHAAILRDGVRQQQVARQQRARKIADRLMKLGLDDPLPAVSAIADNGNVGRPHFARHLVDIGKVKDHKQAFRKYLGAGKPGDVRNHWAAMDDVVRWIREAGGIAVLAHPAHYRLTMTRLRELVADFAAAGGQALEVVSGRQDAAVGRKLAAVANDYRLFASAGSDFHRPGQSWAELGECAPLPENCRPVWTLWQ